MSFETAKRKERTAKVAPQDYGGYPEPPVASPPPRRRHSDGESGSEDDFVKTWRKNRLAELKGGNATTRRQSPSKRKYGRVEIVDAGGYLDAVERVCSETIVVVTIYNDKVNTAPSIYTTRERKKKKTIRQLVIFIQTYV